MDINFTEQKLLPIRRDKQTAGIIFGVGGGSGGSSRAIGGGTVSVDLTPYALIAGQAFTGAISATNLSGTNTGDAVSLGLHAKADDSDKLDGNEGSWYAPINSPAFTGTGSWDSTTLVVDATNHRVGIGTATPLKKLHLTQNGSGTLTIMALEDTNTTNGNGPVVSFRGTTTGTGGAAFQELAGFQATFVDHNHATRKSDFTFFTVGDGTEHDLTFDNLGNIKIPAFSTGFAGSNWQISESGDAEVQNLRVRGALTAYELDINKISSVNGGMMISVANGTCLTVSGTTIYFDEAGASKQFQFTTGDYIKAQMWKTDGTLSYVGHVTSYHHDATYGAAYIVATTISGTPWNGMELVQIGSSTTAARQNLLYLTAADTNSPYMSGYSGVTDGVLSTHEVFRVGNLTGITDATFGALSGYGLYSQNVYLSGNISIAGAISVGTATQSYSGIDLNLAIKGADIWENTRHDGYSGALWINRIGYNGGTTEDRSTYIGNGKGGNLAQFITEGTLTKIILGVSGNESTIYSYVESFPRILSHSTIDSLSTMTATNFVISSDERLKTNIKPLRFEHIPIKYKSFELKSEPGQKRVGVIAQELQKTNPEFVREDDKGFLSVACTDLLMAKVAELEARVKELEGR